MPASKNQPPSLPQIGALLSDYIMRAFRKVKSWLRSLKTSFLTSFALWSDPKLAPYRKVSIQSMSKASPSAPTDKVIDTPAPQTTQELLNLLKRTPRAVLSQRERHIIVSIMRFSSTLVAEIMLPRSVITYVDASEVLGPLTLDRLYRSGFQHFPVINKSHQIIGIIHTTALNSLEIKKTTSAAEILDPKVYYLREDYTLNQALAAFLRTNCYFFLVIDKHEQIIGMLTYQMLIDHLLGETPTDNFTRDDNRLAVAKRKL